MVAGPGEHRRARSSAASSKPGSTVPGGGGSPRLCSQRTPPDGACGCCGLGVRVRVCLCVRACVYRVLCRACVGGVGTRCGKPTVVVLIFCSELSSGPEIGVIYICTVLYCNVRADQRRQI